MLTGNVQEFSWKNVGLAALGGAVTAGIGQMTGAVGSESIYGISKATDPYLYASAVATTGNVITQGIAVKLNWQDKFDWKAVATSAIVAPLSKAVTNGLGLTSNDANFKASGYDKFGASLVSGLIGQSVRMAVYSKGKLDYASLAGDAFGTVLGDGLVEAMKDKPKQQGMKGPAGAYGAEGTPGARLRNIISPEELSSGDELTADAPDKNPVTARLDQFKSPDGKPIYQNDDQRAALIDMLKQDPTMTPEKLAKAQDMALLSNSMYLQDPTDPSKGYRNTVPDHFERVTNLGEGNLKGFNQGDFENQDTGFAAGLFRDKRDGSYTLAFRGTDNGADWLNGNSQALDPDAPQYVQAIDLARNLKRSLGAELSDITGHSLGGGLAAATSMLTGIRATTFNAAGLNPETITTRGGTWSANRMEGLITNYRVQDEVLTNLQERGNFGSIPIALAALAIGPAAFALHGIAASMSDAAGSQITIGAFDQNIQSMSFVERNNVFKLQPVALHGMDYVMRGMLINGVRRP